MGNQPCLGRVLQQQQFMTGLSESFDSCSKAGQPLNPLAAAEGMQSTHWSGNNCYSYRAALFCRRTINQQWEQGPHCSMSGRQSHFVSAAQCTVALSLGGMHVTSPADSWQSRGHLHATHDSEPRGGGGGGGMLYSSSLCSCAQPYAVTGIQLLRSLHPSCPVCGKGRKGK
jgi:hypothetical protein